MSSDHRRVFKKLKEAGFWRVGGSKHDKWTDGERTISVPQSTMTPRTAISIIQQIEKRGPFYHRQQEHLRNRKDGKPIK